MREFILEQLRDAENYLFIMKKDISIKERIAYEKALLKIQIARQLLIKFNVEIK